MSLSADPSANLPRLSEVTRSGRPESTHRGSLCIVRGDEVVYSLGDPEEWIYCRSAVKPLQVLPLLESGAADRFGLVGEELALCSASHNGTPLHVATAISILQKGGFASSDLLCGPHAPFDKQASLDIARGGGKPKRVHNNCSGKHAGFLLLARHCEVPASSYLDPDSDSQVLVREAVGQMCGMDPDDLHVGLDGCGAPTFHMPLHRLARGFAQLCEPQDLAPQRAEACRRMLQAVSHHPVHLAGEGRFCTALHRSLPGQVYGKNGAEGVYALGLPGRGLGIAIKIEDGAERGYWPVLVEILLSLGCWPEFWPGGTGAPADVACPEPLAEFRRVPVRNTQKIEVGEVRARRDWARPEIN